MWWNLPTDGNRNHRPDGDDRDERNQRALLSVALTFALAFLLASHLPPPLLPAALESLLFFGALGAALLALFRGERPNADYLTAWDQALILLCLSLFAGLFTDPAAIAEALDQGAPAPAAQ